MDEEAGCGRNNHCYIPDRHSSTCSPQRPIQRRVTLILFFIVYNRHLTRENGGRNAKLNVHVQLTASYFVQAQVLYSIPVHTRSYLHNWARILAVVRCRLSSVPSGRVTRAAAWSFWLAPLKKRNKIGNISDRSN